MSFDALNRPPPAAPCARCKAPSECEVWGFRICYPCHGDWIHDERFSSGSVNAFLGISNEPEAFTPANHGRYCVEATKRTRAWLTEKAS